MPRLIGTCSRFFCIEVLPAANRFQLRREMLYAGTAYDHPLAYGYETFEPPEFVAVTV